MSKNYFYAKPYPQYDTLIKEGQQYKFWGYFDTKAEYAVDKEDLQIEMSVRSEVTFHRIDFIYADGKPNKVKVPILYEKKIPVEEFEDRPWQDHEIVLTHFMV